jgi:nucleotide-binding universal stress UspA family protein
MTVYRKILVALENSAHDATILEHIPPLAKMCGASLVLIHVADGWAARNIKQLDLRESEEMRGDLAYLEQMAAQLAQDGLKVDAVLAGGDPAQEIAALAEREECDLIAMATHGHRFIQDVLRGSVANEVRHRSTVPVLLVRSKPAPKA